MAAGRITTGINVVCAATAVVHAPEGGSPERRPIMA